MTAEYLLHRVYPVKAGETVLFHAIAGGVGLIACQWLKQIGVTIIGTTGSEKKAEIARAAGCDHVILYEREDIAERVREITQGRGVPVVYDGVGQRTFESSIHSLAPRGLFVSFGNASGPVMAISPLELSRLGSLFFTRPALVDYIRETKELKASARSLFAAYRRGNENRSI